MDNQYDSNKISKRLEMLLQRQEKLSEDIDSLRNEIRNLDNSNDEITQEDTG